MADLETLAGEQGDMLTSRYRTTVNAVIAYQLEVLAEEGDDEQLLNTILDALDTEDRYAAGLNNIRQRVRAAAAAAGRGTVKPCGGESGEGAADGVADAAATPAPAAHSEL